MKGRNIMQGQDIVSVEGLRKAYGEVVAVDEISFQVREGEIFGMVGPNGSGKTTTIECIEGLRKPDAGRVHVFGLDPIKDMYLLRERTGVQLQSSNLPHRLRVKEALDLFASFYKQVNDWHPLVEELGLSDKANAYYSQLSGGQKQRLFVALALINRPEIVFLDELTTGLDPQARHATWDLVRKIQERGCTVFLTTHFMEEAEKLCDRVAILDHGKIVALDSPVSLVTRLGKATRMIFDLNGHDPQSLSVESNPSGQRAFNLAEIGAIDGVQRVDQQGNTVVVHGQGDGWIGAVIMTLEKSRVPFHNLRTEQANLEDTFLALTGNGIRD
jgi:ABC-2 type transport system ATP-binding protein